MLAWKWAEQRLKKGGTYWLATVWPDGRPHLMPVWALWNGGLLYFSTGPRSRKALNLENNPTCVIGTEQGFDAVVVEGTAVRAKRVNTKVLREYKRKYDWDMTSLGNVVYVMRPQIAFGLNDKPEQATRWIFSA
jgi:nitroimidazol reductase NimA-like FMN-containing flavoprotein (pyridoxamine 5'-phosphate oxidase superfamily)